MSVELNELQDSARQVMQGADLAAAEDATWSQIVELGWLMVAIPEDLGGLETGVQGACTMHVELGRGLSRAAYLPAMLALDALCESDLADRDAWIERIISGELVSATLADSTVALQAESLSGKLSAVQSADKAEHLLVWTSAKDLVALVPTATAGVECTARQTWDETRRLYDVSFSAVALSEASVLARGDSAAAMVQRLLAQRDFALAADAIGASQALLERTVEYLKDRVQFKRPLAMFQALKHRCADMKANIAAAEALLFDALRRIENEIGSSDAELKAKSAKLLATSTAMRVAEEALQLHGGIGMADEHPCHLFLKRALLSEQLGRQGDVYAIEVAEGLLAEI